MSRGQGEGREGEERSVFLMLVAKCLYYYSHGMPPITLLWHRCVYGMLYTLFYVYTLQIQEVLVLHQTLFVFIHRL